MTTINSVGDRARTHLECGSCGRMLPVGRLTELGSTPGIYGLRKFILADPAGNQVRFNSDERRDRWISSTSGRTTPDGAADPRSPAGRAPKPAPS